MTLNEFAGLMAAVMTAVLVWLWGRSLSRRMTTAAAVAAIAASLYIFAIIAWPSPCEWFPVFCQESPDGGSSGAQ